MISESTCLSATGFVFGVLITIAIPQVGFAELQHFDSVNQVLADLRSDTSVSFSDKAGWLVAESGFTSWLFTTDRHPAHPAVVERNVFQDGKAIKIGTRVICTKSKEVCNALLSDFTALDGEIKNRASGIRTINQPGLIIAYKRAVVKGGAKIKMLFADDGLRCQHPNDKTMGVG